MDVPKKAPNLEIQRDEEKPNIIWRTLFETSQRQTQHHQPPYLSPPAIVSVQKTIKDRVGPIIIKKVFHVVSVTG